MAAIRLFRAGGARRYVGLLHLENGAVLFQDFNRAGERQAITRIFDETPELQEPQLTSRTSEAGLGDDRHPDTFDRYTFPWLELAVVQFIAPMGYTFAVEG